MAQERKLKITVDHDVCVGNAMCETFATNTFALNDDRQSEAVNPQGDPLAQVLGSGRQLPGKRHNSGRCGNGRTAVPIEIRRTWQREEPPDRGLFFFALARTFLASLPATLRNPS